MNADHNETIKLTHFSHGMGCGCKMRPQYLEKILKNLPVPLDPAVLVGTSTSDDATVYQINDEQAIVQTVDFFTPIVDDPYDFGAIAAANAMSDIYAMGGKPLFALNVVAFPSKKLSGDVLEAILRGASDKAAEAGISILGGHSIDDEEPKFGMTVTGIIHPAKILMNCNAKPGDVLILTKSLGTGIISTAIRKEISTDNSRKEAVESMKTLNKMAAEVISGFPVNACTDVTGFGLLGHLSEMTRGSKVNAEVFFSKLPLMEGIYKYAEDGAVSGGTKGNVEYYSTWIQWSDELDIFERYIFCDAQTSGGLLISIPEESAPALIDALHAKKVLNASVIGRIVQGNEGIISALK
ncbi:MAG: selenide, water dikinase SelD [Bacteroidales bacterium]|nr:selenide, water dikinase SelD [Bacteroidales bacterium]